MNQWIDIKEKEPEPYGIYEVLTADGRVLPAEAREVETEFMPEVRFPSIPDAQYYRPINK